MDKVIIPADECQHVTLPVDFYADMVAQLHTLNLLKTALLENMSSAYDGSACVTSTFNDAVKAIMPDVYAKMQAKADAMED